MSQSDLQEAPSCIPAARPLRIGVLCDAGPLTAWQRDCLAHVERLPFARIVLVVRNSLTKDRQPSSWRSVRQKLASGLLLWRIYERAVVDRRSRARRAVPNPSFLQDVPSIDVEPIRVGKFRQAFGRESLEAVRKHEVDVLLRFGFGILSGDILDIPTFGVWSFHHGDPKQFRGVPAGFWELHDGSAVTGVILQRLTETLDGGVVLHAGWFKTNTAWYSKSLDHILFGAAHFVARALGELRQDPDKLMNREPLQNFGPIYRHPRTRAMLRFFVKTAAAIIRNQYRAFFVHQQWSVGLLDRGSEAIFENLSGKARRIEGVKWLQETRKRFLADPFIVDGSGETLIIAEEFDWKTGRGRISTVPFTASGDCAPECAIQSSHHLSYPYIFGYRGQTYCAPECAESNGVPLYRLIEDEGRWIKHKQLLSGFPAVDPTIFQHEGHWWLFCTDGQAGPNESLHAWYADDPTGEWVPHQLNPLKVDIRSARPAGVPFISQGALIRPAQDCSHGYGGAITFNVIVKLTPNEFLEEPAGQLLPGENSYPAALHTIASCGERAIIDGARLTFIPEEFWRTARKRVRLLRR